MGCYLNQPIGPSQEEILSIEELVKRSSDKLVDKNASINLSLDSTCEQIVLPKTRNLSKNLDVQINHCETYNQQVNNNYIEDKLLLKPLQINNHEHIHKEGNPLKSLVSTAYEDELFRLFNKLRTNPKSFIPSLEKIINDKVSNEKVLKDNHIKLGNNSIFLNEGVESIKKCIEFLKTQIPLAPLKKNLSLKIEVPEVHQWNNPKYISHLVNNKKADLKSSGNHKSIGFNIDITQLCPTSCLLLQIIDDNGLSGLRRRNIFNENYNSCCITTKSIQSAENRRQTFLVIYSVFN